MNTYLYIHVHTYIHAYIYTCKHVCICLINAYTHTHTHTEKSAHELQSHKRSRSPPGHQVGERNRDKDQGDWGREGLHERQTESKREEEKRKPESLESTLKYMYTYCIGSPETSASENGRKAEQAQAIQKVARASGLRSKTLDILPAHTQVVVPTNTQGGEDGPDNNLVAEAGHIPSLSPPTPPNGADGERVWRVQ